MKDSKQRTPDEPVDLYYLMYPGAETEPPQEESHPEDSPISFDSELNIFFDLIFRGKL